MAKIINELNNKDVVIGHRRKGNKEPINEKYKKPYNNKTKNMFKSEMSVCLKKSLLILVYFRKIFINHLLNRKIRA